MSNVSKRKRNNPNMTMKQVTADHGKFLKRITKTLYYGKLPSTERLSMPMSELAVELFSDAHRGHTLQRLQMNAACNISRSACVSPCALVLAMLYLDRLRDCNPDYVRRVAPSELFLVSLMISSKFLHDDGAEDEVFLDEWAISGGITVSALKQLEKDFLNAMDWKIFISQTTFWSEFENLEQILAWREANKRGWFSYSELSILLPSADIVKIICCATGILTVSYIASLIILVGAVFITSQIPGNSLSKDTFVKNSDVLINENTTMEDVVVEEIDINSLLEYNDTGVSVTKDILTANKSVNDMLPEMKLSLTKDKLTEIGKFNISSEHAIWLKYKDLAECLDLHKENYCTVNNAAVWYSLIF